MTEYRCRYCNALLFKGRLTIAEIEIKCRHAKCGAMNLFAKVDSRTPLAV